MIFSFARESGAMPLLFLPGWGFDARLARLYRLFHGRCLLLPVSFLDPASLTADLFAFLHKEKIDKIAIKAWSMGAQLGLDFCLTHPGLVARLDLVAMRRSWPQQEIDAIREGVSSDLPGYMREFYRKSFLGYKKAYHEFQHGLQDQYLAELNPEILFAGLDYLARFTLPEKLPSETRVTVIHGRRDLVAPVSQMVRIPGAASEILPYSGHMVLLDQPEKQQ
jgi:pimeloyl-ACP methyl ester carboxylesterase